MPANHQLQLTGAAILVSRASLSYQATPATELGVRRQDEDACELIVISVPSEETFQCAL